jgi:diguanylate cyclase (GGDEF)-like protein
MNSAFKEPSSRRFVTRTALPIISAALLTVLIVAGVLAWSGFKADQISIERQESLVRLVVSQMRSSLARDQESATVWDDAVERVREGDAEWIDANLGSWMNSYFGHDGAFVLDTGNRPLYAFIDGAVSPASEYGQVEAQAQPLVLQLRDLLRDPAATQPNDGNLSVGVADLAVVKGHPAVVSVKPIVSDTGDIQQEPGSENLHVAVRYLDDSFLTNLSRDYLVQDMRFSWTAQPAPGEIGLALTSASNEVIGYFMWKPYRPGTAVMSIVAPALGILFLLTGTTLALLIRRLRNRSLSLQAREAEVHHLAMHDQLTGLRNRAAFNRRLDQLLAKAKGEDRLAVLYLDLDRFKQVNDTLGHPTGDELIRQFANRVNEIVRSHDIVARIGGDEFVIALAQVRSLADVEDICRRIIASVNQPFDIDGNHINVGVSIGVALSPVDGTSRIELTRKADIALYHAKAAGRGRYAMFGQDMDALVQERRTIERDLRTALSSSNQIEVVFQPLFSADSHAVTGVEALARWRHPERGPIPPDEFIPVAEDTRLIEKLGEIVLRKACEAAKAWPIDKVAVNVSAVELRDPLYAIRVANILLGMDMNPRQLELEVTESTLTDGNGVCESNIRALRDLGVQIALDDFGTGFSSLSRLQNLAVDRIKVDRSFVQGLGQSGSDEAIIQAIITLAKATGLKTTAEGVETVEQENYLGSIGCDDLQGFLLSQPISADEMSTLLQKGRPALLPQKQRGG